MFYMQAASRRIFFAASVALGIAGCLPAHATEAPLPLQRQVLPPPTGGVRISGRIESYAGSGIVLRLRTGQTAQVDVSNAIKNHQSVVLYQGAFVQVEGALLASGLLEASVIKRAKPDEAAWPADVY